MFSKISQNSQKNTCDRVSFLTKLQVETCNFIKKEILAQVFSCKFCEISKNTFFTEHLWATVSSSANTLVVCDKYSLFLHSAQFSSHNVEAFLIHFGAKKNFFTFPENEKKLNKWQRQPPDIVCKKAVLKNFAIFTRKYLFWSFFF